MDIKSIGIVQSTLPIQNKQISGKKNSGIISADNRSIMNSLNFLGNYNTPVIKKSLDNPIQNDEEYNEVMKRVYEAKSVDDQPLWIPSDYRDKQPDYRKATDIEMGLIPYCGKNDNSEIINMYLTGRLDDEPMKFSNKRSRIPQDKGSCIDVIRAFDYALGNLDREFGKYDGIVFRIGYMSEDGKQYFSTAKSTNMVSFLAPSCWYDFANEREKYSVIRVKDAHKIYEFQNKMGCEYGDFEEEILTPRNSKFIKLNQNEMDSELLNAREELAKNLFCGADLILSGKINSSGYTREKLLNFVDVYEQI